MQEHFFFCQLSNYLPLLTYLKLMPAQNKWTETMKKEEKENINLQIHLKQYLYKIC